MSTQRASCCGVLCAVPHALCAVPSCFTCCCSSICSALPCSAPSAAPLGTFPIRPSPASPQPIPLAECFTCCGRWGVCPRAAMYHSVQCVASQRLAEKRRLATTPGGGRSEKTKSGAAMAAPSAGRPQASPFACTGGPIRRRRAAVRACPTPGADPAVGAWWH